MLNCHSLMLWSSVFIEKLETLNCHVIDVVISNTIKQRFAATELNKTHHTGPDLWRGQRHPSPSNPPWQVASLPREKRSDHSSWMWASSGCPRRWPCTLRWWDPRTCSTQAWTPCSPPHCCAPERTSNSPWKWGTFSPFLQLRCRPWRASPAMPRTFSAGGPRRSRWWTCRGRRSRRKEREERARREVHGGKRNASFRRGLPWWGSWEGDGDDEGAKDDIYNFSTRVGWEFERWERWNRKKRDRT